MENWATGLGFSVVFGGVVTAAFLEVLRTELGLAQKPPGLRVPAWLTGAVERAFFTTLVGMNQPSVPTAMVAWLALKLAANWNHPDLKDVAGARAFAFSALLAGLISMFMAFAGGLIASGHWRLWVAGPALLQ